MRTLLHVGGAIHQAGRSHHVPKSRTIALVDANNGAARAWPANCTPEYKTNKQW